MRLLYGTVHVGTAALGCPSGQFRPESGYKGPLNRCTLYVSKEAGAKFNKMLAMGQSKPWPDALDVLTGERQTDAGALLEYFAPLKQWLDEQNKGKNVGW
jgi:peptidyl-dipeptidase A